MTTKHTPGPWLVSTANHRRRIVTQKTGETIDAISGRTTMEPYLVATVSDHRPADANLIAAAPDLLQILETIVEDVGYGGGGAKLCEQFLNRAKPAIARARG